MGVITYILLVGYPPFHASDNLALFRKIRNGEWAFQSPWWDSVSAGAKDLVRKLLVLKPDERLTATEARAAALRVMRGMTIKHTRPLARRWTAAGTSPRLAYGPRVTGSKRQRMRRRAPR